MSKTEDQATSEDRKSMVRILAAVDRHSDRHKKIYEDLAEE